MLPEKVSLQLSSEQSVGDVWIAQLDRKRVPQSSSSADGHKILEETNVINCRNESLSVNILLSFCVDPV